MRLHKPGIYSGIPLTDYVLDPAPEPSLSSGVAHVLVEQTPRHAWQAHPQLNPGYQSKDATHFDIGTVAHSLLLENDRSKIVVIEADDWKKKVNQEARDDAREAGKTPLLAHQMAQVEEMVTVAREEIEHGELGDIWKAGGDAEQTLLWQEYGIWLRSRPDWLSKDRRVCVNYKTTTCAAPNVWLRTMLSHGCEMQAAIELRGVNHLCQPHDCTFVFLVQEVEEPYALCPIGLSPKFLSLGEKKLLHAMAIWRQCMESNDWPAYPSQICYLDVPTWAMTQWDDRQALEQIEEGLDGLPIS